MMTVFLSFLSCINLRLRAINFLDKMQNENNIRYLDNLYMGQKYYLKSKLRTLSKSLRSSL